MAKRIPKDIKSKIKKEYELGEDLIELAIKYGVNYGTLRHIASKKKWEKNRVTDLAWLKEVEKLSTELAIKREKKKQEYQAMTQELLNDLKSLEKLGDDNYYTDEETPKSFAESKATVIKVRASTLKEVYSLDKELHNILTQDEYITLITKSVKLEDLKERLNKKDSGDSDEDMIID